MAFHVKRATTLEQVWKYMEECPKSCLIAGGTDRIPRINQGIERCEQIICLDGIDALRSVDETRHDIRIGALTKLVEITELPILAPYTALQYAASRVASPPIRNQATVGGNLLQETRCIFFNQSVSWRRVDVCYRLGGTRCFQYKASPRCVALLQSDLAPVMLAYGAVLVFESPEGRREMPLSELYLQAGAKNKRPEEILLEIRLPKPKGTLHSAYARETIRGSFDFPLVSCAVAVETQGERIERASMVIGSAADRPACIEEFAAMQGKPLHALYERQGEFLAVARKKIMPFRDSRVDASVRKAMGEAVIKSALEQSIKQ